MKQLKQELQRLARLQRLLLKLRTGNRRGIGARVLRLRARLRQGAHELLRRPALRRIPGALAFVLGLGMTPQLDAQITFGPAQVNAFGIVGSDEVLLPKFVDIDADGDLDIFVSSYGAFQLYTNTGTADDPNFEGAPTINPFGLDAVTGEIVAVGDFADLDGDGDLDFLSSEYSVLYYYENTGTAQTPQFGTPIAGPYGLDLATDSYLLPVFVDMDNDGDTDLLIGGYNTTQYFENTGSVTAPAFAAPLNDPFGIDSSPPQPDQDSYLFYAAGDLDGDGDIDLVQGQYYGTLRYYENTGTAEAPAFAPPVDEFFGFSPISEETFVLPTLGDIDNDGDLDLLTNQYDYGMSTSESFLVYYENTTGDEVRVREVPADFVLEISPNPASDLIRLRANHSLAGVELFDATGKLVLTRAGSTDQISVHDLPQGLYQLRVVLSDGSAATERISVLR